MRIDPRIERRISRSLSQYARSVEVVREVDLVMSILSSIYGVAGKLTRSRKMLFRIGQLLLTSESIEIIAPSCPDYSHVDGKYTFQGLSGGVSLLAQKHIEYLRTLADIIPGLKPIILIADLESEDELICVAVGKSKSEFDSEVLETLDCTRSRVSRFGWEVELMTNVVPDLRAREVIARRWIEDEERFSARLTTEMIARINMYRRIDSHMSQEEMMSRTIRTAAQYIALGRKAFEIRALVCNHTTTNLSWYLQTGVGIIHNPISVY